MDNVIIKEVETHKHLGLTISEDGNWNEHVKNIMIKVSPRSSVFRRMKFKPKRSSGILSHTISPYSISGLINDM
jgi:hypothetical protein